MGERGVGASVAGREGVRARARENGGERGREKGRKREKGIDGASGKGWPGGEMYDGEDNDART